MHTILSFRRKFSFIRRQRSFKLRSTLQELDAEDVLVLSRKEIRDGQVWSVAWTSKTISLFL